MTDIITIPFNHEPIDNLENVASYTAGSGDGDYAIMQVTLSANAHSSATGGGLNSIYSTNASSNSTTLTMRIKKDAVVTKTETAASATTGAITSGNSGFAISFSEAIVLVDGTVAGSIRASATVSVFAGTSNLTGSIAGSAQVTYQISEYNSIT